MTPEDRAGFKADLWLVLRADSQNTRPGYDETFSRLFGDRGPHVNRPGLKCVEPKLYLWVVEDREAFLDHLVELRGRELVSWALMELEGE